MLSYHFNIFQFNTFNIIQSSIFISYLPYISILCLHSKDFQKTLEILEWFQLGS